MHCIRSIQQVIPINTTKKWVQNGCNNPISMKHLFLNQLSEKYPDTWAINFHVAITKCQDIFSKWLTQESWCMWHISNFLYFLYSIFHGTLWGISQVCISCNMPYKFNFRLNFAYISSTLSGSSLKMWVLNCTTSFNISCILPSLSIGKNILTHGLST